LVSTYPGLIAAAHVLLRLLAPRHPPCALILLIGEEHQIQRCHYGVFKVRTGRVPAIREKAAFEGGLSKLNSVVIVEVDVLLGELGIRTAVAIKRAERLPKQELRIP